MEFSQQTETVINKAEKSLENYFAQLATIRDYNQKKVLKNFIENKVGSEHFSYVSGYGHDDMGRDTLDQLFADIFCTEKALVRPHFVSGTHAISCVLFGLLRPDDTLVSVTGAPYDTLEEIIGKRGNTRDSLKSFGVKYKEISLLGDGSVDFERLEEIINDKCKVVLIQRSRGYAWRKSLSLKQIEEIVNAVKSINSNCICFVDNCYGEFTQTLEPTEVGADIIAGSLIKNMGGGIVEAGGYVAGKEEYVLSAANRLTSPGIGTRGGSMMNQTRTIFQGVFMAPSIVHDALKGVVLSAKIFQDIGYETSPSPFDERSDIIQAIKIGSREKLIEFCNTIQSLSPIDSYVSPIPYNVPGYEDEIIMAAGNFIEGSTIELSADAPLREPYIVYFQGGLNYSHIKIVIASILEKFL